VEVCIFIYFELLIHPFSAAKTACQRRQQTCSLNDRWLGICWSLAAARD